MHSHLLQMLNHSNFLSLHHSATSNTFSLRAFPRFLVSHRDFPPKFVSSGMNSSKMASFDAVSVDSSVCRIHSNDVQSSGVEFDTLDLDRFADVGNQLADAAGDVIRKYFRKSFDILDKEDLSPVTIADQAAEESMVQIIQANFPSHAIYGEENGWRCKEKVADHVWVLDPIDGTKSFITGKPLFGTLIALLHMGKPILGIIDQPVLRERWIGLSGRKSTLNGQEISTRNCSQLSKAYLYTTSPHLFSGDAEVAFARVRSKVWSVHLARFWTYLEPFRLKKCQKSITCIILLIELSWMVFILFFLMDSQDDASKSTHSQTSKHDQRINVLNDLLF
ncbi:hypothetical protein F511_18051 [Dorcoceras hygrometricum]|uniref:Bifunctional phosphatase IMPL2, chloroplastic n=1 Tax=Dorcoceras hygrometricum TaxID=472368 RepID=A0A2Z7BT92_9LAMI|nr:hypothetical protein F511_18051 [Dorcoceras hygrometricum]